MANPTTNVPPVTFGPDGFVIPQTSSILAGVQADINSAFGGNLNPSLETPQGQIASSEAAVIDAANQTFLYQSQMTDPAYAEGRWQDAIGRIYFLERNPAQPTSVQCLCTGLADVPIPAGAQAVAEDGNIYVCTTGGTIPVSGSITLTFACTVNGPITCPADTVNEIYQSIPGWDSINNASEGVLGQDVESRSAFETRRQQTVAANSIGSLPSVLGSVLTVPGVVDAFVYENVNATALTYRGFTLLPNSIYVAAAGSATSLAIATAIWKKKAPGCQYNGNTVVTVLDQNSGYSPPYPAYQVTYESPASLPILFNVILANNAAVPSNAATLIQNAIINAFAGGDGGLRARIGSTVYASRFICPVAAVGSWVQIISLQVGSTNTPIVNFTGAMLTANSDILTVSAITSGGNNLAVGQVISDAAGALPAGTTILSQQTGTTGGTGTYALSFAPQTIVTSEAMQSLLANQNDVVVNIDQIPTISANDISVSTQ